MNLLIVTGLSGAGKSSVLAALEDRGFYCVDNLPSALIVEFVKLCSQRNHRTQDIAVVIDAREYLLGSQPEDSFSLFESLEDGYKLLFLDCRDEIIERRYNQTRRVHPIKNTIADGIALERDFLSIMRDRADHIIDTSDLTPNELKAKLIDLLELSTEQPFSLVIQSFAYKRGVPIETDMVMDMRFVKNPFYVPELRMLSGLDKPIIDYLNDLPAFGEALNSIEAQLNGLIPRFIEQGKHRLMVSFGCTGGRHRSVCAAEDMYRRMSKKYSTTIIHRDLKLWRPTPEA